MIVLLHKSRLALSDRLADAGLWLLDAGHFATEHPAILLFRDTLRQQTASRGWTLPIDVACQQPPLRLI